MQQQQQVGTTKDRRIRVQASSGATASAYAHDEIGPINNDAKESGVGAAWPWRLELGFHGCVASITQLRARHLVWAHEIIQDRLDSLFEQV